MDYDKTEMPQNYDSGRGYAPEVLARWLNVIARHAGDATIADILDLGCGTGRYSEALAARFHARVIALDPSEKMLEAARRKATGRVRYERASAEDLPLDSASVDMVFVSMVLHHFRDRPRALAECRRVLKPGGRFFLRAGTRDRIGEYPYLPFFPRSRAILEVLMQSTAEIESLFADAGFRPAAYELVPSQTAANWLEYAERVSYRADSILIQLTDPEFAAGLEALRRHASAMPKSKPVIEPVDFFVFA
jgi:ubiquinone/menaquinone biosynthesis C-methylase UbiE